MTFSILLQLSSVHEIIKGREVDAATRDLMEKQERLWSRSATRSNLPGPMMILASSLPSGNISEPPQTQPMPSSLIPSPLYARLAILRSMQTLCLRKFSITCLITRLRYGEGVTKIRLYGAMDGKELLLYFEDNGIGIMGNDKSRIFSRVLAKTPGWVFSLTREILAITRIGITENGEDRKGARFVIRVPRGAYRLMK